MGAPPPPPPGAPGGPPGGGYPPPGGGYPPQGGGSPPQSGGYPPQGGGYPPPGPGAYTPPPPRAGGAGKIGLIVGVIAVLVGAFALFRVFTGGGDETPVAAVSPTPSAQASPAASSPPAAPTPAAPSPAATAEPSPAAPEPTAEPSPQPQPEPEQPDPVPQDNDGQNTPPEDQSASIEQLVQDPVGPFNLQQAAEIPDLINAGAVGAIGTVYRGRGTDLFHLLSVWPDRQTANGFGDAVAASVQEGGGQLLDQQPRQNGNGERIGTIWVLQAADGGLVLAFSNGQGYFTIEGGDPDAVGEFFSNLPY